MLQHCNTCTTTSLHRVRWQRAHGSPPCRAATRRTSRGPSGWKAATVMCVRGSWPQQTMLQLRSAPEGSDRSLQEEAQGQGAGGRGRQASRAEARASGDRPGRQHCSAAMRAAACSHALLARDPGSRHAAAACSQPRGRPGRAHAPHCAVGAVGSRQVLPRRVPGQARRLRLELAEPQRLRRRRLCAATRQQGIHVPAAHLTRKEEERGSEHSVSTGVACMPRGP